MKNRTGLRIISFILAVISGALCLLSAAGAVILFDRNMFDDRRSAQGFEKKMTDGICLNLAAGLAAAYISDGENGVRAMISSRTEYGDMEYAVTVLPAENAAPDNGKTVISSDNFNGDRIDGSFECRTDERVFYYIDSAIGALFREPEHFVEEYYEEDEKYPDESYVERPTAMSETPETTTGAAVPADVPVPAENESLTGISAAAPAETAAPAEVTEPTTVREERPGASRTKTGGAQIIRVDYSLSDIRSGILSEATDKARLLYVLRQYSVPAAAVSLIVFIVSVVLLIFSVPARITKANRIPFIFTLAALAGAAGAGGLVALEAFHAGITDTSGIYSSLALAVGAALTLAAFAAAALLICDLTRRIKARKFRETTLCHYAAAGIGKLAGKLSGSIPTLIKALIIEAVLTLLELIALTAGDVRHAGLIFTAFFIYKAAEIAFVVIAAIQMTELKNGAKRIADGDYSTPVDTSKMFPEFRAHGSDLNRARDGLSAAVDGMVKSERMKAELITNVSHDIKTPLTSIINYADLLSADGVDESAQKEYIAALQRQADKLKKLISDLTEASKASTGNIDIKRESISVGTLISQAAGEYDDKFRARGLTLIVKQPEEELFAMADGRYVWRVFDNLFGNAAKYAMPGTRVYCDVSADGKNVTVALKNISEAQLNIPAEELTGRFARGDKSRSTEGSGLGLSIAGDLTRLMGGRLDVNVNGDLFEAVITLVRSE